MCLLVKYYKEREGLEYTETNKFCFTYKVNETFFYVKDFYVEPEFRGKETYKEVMDELLRLANENECKYIMGSTDIKTNNTKMLKIFKNLGFKYYERQKDLNIFIKEI